MTAEPAPPPQNKKKKKEKQTAGAENWNSSHDRGHCGRLVRMDYDKQRKLYSVHSTEMRQSDNEKPASVARNVTKPARERNLAGAEEWLGKKVGIQRVNGIIKKRCFSISLMCNCCVVSNCLHMF